MPRPRREAEPGAPDPGAEGSAPQPFQVAQRRYLRVVGLAAELERWRRERRRKGQDESLAPLWVKLEVRDLLDPAYTRLSCAERGLLHDLRRVAASARTDVLACDPKALRRSLQLWSRHDAQRLEERLAALVESGFVVAEDAGEEQFAGGSRAVHEQVTDGSPTDAEQFTDTRDTGESESSSDSRRPPDVPEPPQREGRKEAEEGRRRDGASPAGWSRAGDVPPPTPATTSRRHNGNGAPSDEARAQLLDLAERLARSHVGAQAAQNVRMRLDEGIDPGRLLEAVERARSCGGGDAAIRDATRSAALRGNGSAERVLDDQRPPCTRCGVEPASLRGICAPCRRDEQDQEATA